MKHKKLTQDRVVYFINYVMLAVFLIIVLYPLIYIISCSFSSGDALMSGKVKLFPVEPTLQSYRAVFKDGILELDCLYTRRNSHQYGSYIVCSLPSFPQ